MERCDLFKNIDGTYKGAALLIYRGDSESYFTFITPEACKAHEIFNLDGTLKDPKQEQQVKDICANLSQILLKLNA